MFDCATVAEELAAADDPRLDREYFRCIPGDGDARPVLLVGVVHDHPASVSRVVRTLERFAPDTLAVELPPLAMPLFGQYAADSHRPPRLGGEMSAAIQAAGTASVGVDAPTASYLARLAERVCEERPSMSVLGRLARDLGAAAAQALATRAAGLLAVSTPLRLRVYTPVVHDCSLVDPPDVQAADERAYLERRDALFSAIRPPQSTRIIDDAREAAMGDLLDRVRAEGSVVAVVGLEHLDAVAADLQN